jgi:hypothetical protein
MHNLGVSVNLDGFARNWDNVSEWSYMSTHELLYLWATCTTIKIQLCVLVQSTEQLKNEFIQQLQNLGDSVLLPES